MIPRFNHSRETARSYGELLTKIHAREVHLLPFHQFGMGKWKALGLKYDYENDKTMHEEDVREMADVLEGYGLKVQING